MTAEGAQQSPFELVETGSGDPVLLVHGSASDRRTWSGLQLALADDFRLVAYSRRWHWPNEPPGESDDYSMTEHVDDLGDVIRSLDVGPVHVVGHSYGGFVALLAALASPELVRSMVVIEPPVVPLFLSNKPKLAEVLRTLMTRPRLAVALISFGVRGIGPATKAAERHEMDKALRIFAPAVLGKETFGVLSESRLAQARDNNLRAEYTGSGFAPLTADDVRRVHTRTLVVTGERSPAVWSLLAAELAELLPDSELVEIPGASHIVHEDNESDFSDAVRQFLGTSGSGPG